MIETAFDVPFVADLALREKQIQQNYRPIIAVHKWFARRPGTLFRALLLSEFEPGALRDSFFRSHDLAGKKVADPFMGGGTPLLEANRVGCDVRGYDINPMAWWIVRQELAHLDLDAYRQAAAKLRQDLACHIGPWHQTRCLNCGQSQADVKYFLWVKTLPCPRCATKVDLFPGYLLAEDRRHPANVFVCASCGSLTECADRRAPGACSSCGKPIRATGPAQGGACLCPKCGAALRYPDAAGGVPSHRLFALEYHCHACAASHAGRFFKKPDADDLRHAAEAEAACAEMQPRFVPADEIPSGDETDRLHRWGYRRYREMFSARQLVGLEWSCRLISKVEPASVREALATNLSDLLRYQNMLCRYDTMALKSLDVFSVHGFPVGLVQCESNLLGVWRNGGSASIGSGGWTNMVEKYQKAKAYCVHPFEIRHEKARKIVVPIEKEWIGVEGNGQGLRGKRQAVLECLDAGTAALPAGSLDAVFTDPPYFGNVQYAELMDFCYVWLRQLVREGCKAFELPSTRHAGELTGNANMGRGLESFAEGLSAVFRRMAQALKPGAPLAFTYHHNQLEAYLPVAVALLDSRLVCTAGLPCPAEMGASIHISGTGSSIVDTVFVCRSTGKIPRHCLTEEPEGIAALVRADAARLAEGGVKVTRGDVRCIVFGHLTRLATWFLRKGWSSDVKMGTRLDRVRAWMDRIGAPACVERELKDLFSQAPARQAAFAMEEKEHYGATVSF